MAGGESYEFTLKNDNILLPYVRHQGKMGCCSALTVGEATTAVFANLFKHQSYRDIYGYVAPFELSIQQLIDYVPKKFNYKERRMPKDKYGCYFSNHIDPFKYVQEEGLCLIEDYPSRHSRIEEEIPTIPAGKPRYRIRSFQCVSEIGSRLMHYGWRITEYQINCILHKQPIVAAIDVSVSFLRFKGQGIFMGCQPHEERSKIAHSVLIIGYGALFGIKFFVIKNSHGEHWGDGGYARVKRELLYDLVFPNLYIQPEREQPAQSKKRKRVHAG